MQDVRTDQGVLLKKLTEVLDANKAEEVACLSDIAFDLRDGPLLC